MNDLITVRRGEALTDSVIIANGTGIAHRYIKEQVRKYQNQIEELGLLVGYATESTGGRPEEYYELNEPQATFLMTLLKNTPVVVKFKLELVKQFYQMHILLQGRATQAIDTTLESRISALEQRFSAGNTSLQANKNALETAYFNAINEALREGYYLRRQRQKVTDEAKLLGTYDGEFYYIISRRAYDLYATKTETPVPKQGLNAYLLNGGFIKINTRQTDKYGSMLHRKSIDGQHLSVPR